ncbi:hypothetical protein CBE01nite_48840 [Clostridium beijerinckii]|uniref:hypothetical protein n=1 Tax=Clostridium beijerinckii TaxID=1520 RepID=UPI00098C678F|nr:hypothetical protein [Clostridium beijerinckii]NRZ26522.1 hypothetical protein [Clostridium beijerinckii]NYB97677.1 hypothetical protein [Clostridium beijerinckii]OOM20808.1 hypothetical protein CLBEI_41950 [Clostridium beijerinckii]SQB19191.1 Uncharacterised protein [Clostridium beijerinckii]GEP67116.1 hypothetical protein CBE01nite_48840 [Clostridium beijerinckii]
MLNSINEGGYGKDCVTTVKHGAEEFVISKGGVILNAIYIIEALTLDCGTVKKLISFLFCSDGKKILLYKKIKIIKLQLF